MFSIIAAIGQNRELGQSGRLVFHLKDDMRFFRTTTAGHPVVMGRKTWESLPGKLPNRQNIVISHRNIPGADFTIHDLAPFITAHQSSPEEFFIIGGAAIYAAFLPYARHLYLTEIAASTPADTFFPAFDPSLYHRSLIKKGTENGIEYSIVKYTLI